MSNRHMFTSESVTEGHPDKVADGISDAILDAILAQDRKSRVACETLVSTGMAVVAGEITTRAVINYADVVRDKIRRIGPPIGGRSGSGRRDKPPSAIHQPDGGLFVVLRRTLAASPGD